MKHIGGRALWIACLLCIGGITAADENPATLQVGTLLLHRCGGGPAYCGDLDRPMDPTGAIPGRLSVHFEYYPHSESGKSAGTLVATEGGPGFAATESRDDYLALYRPLRRNHDVLIMDNRGTGLSGAVDCPELQSAEKWTVPLIGACGDSLGNRAPLYSTAYATDDLAAVLTALKIDRIDLYGDSYGTYFEQVFAVRHPQALRSLVLDGAYPLRGPDYPWWPTYAPAMRDKFNIACRRSEACAKVPGSSIDHMRPALDQLRGQPFAATAADGDGKMLSFTANASQFAIVLFGSAPAAASVREADAAARAFAAGDRVPLLRLMAETISGVDSRDPTADPKKWSAGLAAAVMCQDPPQIFDMRLTPALRAADRDRTVAQRQANFPDTYAPFSIDEFRGMPLDYSFLDQCVAWPVSPADHPASHVVGAEYQYPDVPALVLSGELDNMTTTADGAAVARTFKHGRQIRILNSLHVNALPRARSQCAAGIVRRFFDTQSPGDIQCAGEVPPLRLVPQFARHASELDPAAAQAGNRADAGQLKVVSAAVQTAGDVLARLESNSSGEAKGLRGGSFRIVRTDAATRLKLDGVRWTEDLSVSGTIDRLSQSGEVRAALELRGTAGSGRLEIRWREGVAHATARITGEIDGARVVSRQTAP
jgi:pimeloyl-ACP methyl ester carboxylesterase